MRALRVVFEAFSAFFVIAALLTAIYSDSRLLRAIAGIALVFLVSAATTSLVLRMERRDQ